MLSISGTVACMVAYCTFLSCLYLDIIVITFVKLLFPSLSLYPSKLSIHLPIISLKPFAGPQAPKGFPELLSCFKVMRTFPRKRFISIFEVVSSSKSSFLIALRERFSKGSWALGLACVNDAHSELFQNQDGTWS